MTHTLHTPGDTGAGGVLSEALVQLGRVAIRHRAIDPGVAAVRVSGELDLASVGELEAAVEHALTQRSGPLLVDLTACGFIDSSVVSLLVDLRMRLDGSGRRRLTVVAQNQPLHILQLTGLDHELSVFSSVPEALEALEVAATSEFETEV